jgi:hypothetical protein
MWLLEIEHGVDTDRDGVRVTAGGSCVCVDDAEVAHQRRVRDCIRKDSLTVQRT